jgi:hypothetical protein
MVSLGFMIVQITRCAFDSPEGHGNTPSNEETEQIKLQRTAPVLPIQYAGTRAKWAFDARQLF